jgi:large subunit ribosomal protein L21e
MPIRSKGLRSKTRGVFTKRSRDRGVLPPNAVLRDFPEGARVAVVMESSRHKGMVHKRFQGQTGVVVGKQGEAFLVNITHGNKPKQLILRAEHIKQME